MKLWMTVLVVTIAVGLAAFHLMPVPHAHVHEYVWKPPAWVATAETIYAWTLAGVYTAWALFVLVCVIREWLEDR